MHHIVNHRTYYSASKQRHSLHIERIRMSITCTNKDNIHVLVIMIL